MSKARYGIEISKLELLPEKPIVPDGLAWSVESYIEIECTINEVGLDYDNSTLTNTSKCELIRYLMTGHNQLCHCGSENRYEECHAETELPKLINYILRMNIN